MFGGLKGSFRQQQNLSPNGSKGRSSRSEKHPSVHVAQETSVVHERGHDGEGIENAATTTEELLSTAVPPTTTTSKQEPAGLAGSQMILATLSLHGFDRIRLLHLPAGVCDAVRNKITATWPKGIQVERDHHVFLEFKLRRNPWSPMDDEFVHANRLTRGIVETLHSYGWVLYVASDVSMKLGDHTTLFLRHRSPSPPASEWCTCAFKGADRIRLIDVPREVVDDVIAQPELSIKNHEPHKLPGVYKMKLNGFPFGADKMESRLIAMQLLLIFARHGFTLYLSINQTSRSDNGQAMDSWHFERAVK